MLRKRELGISSQPFYFISLWPRIVLSYMIQQNGHVGKQDGRMAGRHPGSHNDTPEWLCFSTLDSLCLL